MLSLSGFQPKLSDKGGKSVFVKTLEERVQSVFGSLVLVCLLYNETPSRPSSCSPSLFCPSSISLRWLQIGRNADRQGCRQETLGLEEHQKERSGALSGRRVCLPWGIAPAFWFCGVKQGDKLKIHHGRGDGPTHPSARSLAQSVRVTHRPDWRN